MKRIINNKNNFFKELIIRNIKTVVLSAVCLCYNGVATYAQSNKATIQASTAIHFTDSSWDQLLKQAAKENKYIFVDAYASWCGPCKQLRATTFKDKNAAEYFNSHFINASFDVEKGEGPELAARWKIQGLPTLLIFNAKGKQVGQAVGYIGAKDFIAFGKTSLAKH